MTFIKSFIDTQNMSREKLVYKHAISSSHKMKIARLETEMIMESFDKPSTSDSTLYHRNKLRNENELENKNELQNEIYIQNENRLQNGNELLNENKLQKKNFLSDNDIAVNESNNESDQNIAFKKFLANWAVTECIPQSSLRLLLKGIKQYTCENCNLYIPSDPRSLVHTPRNTYTDICGDGHYYHFGLSKAILSAISSISRNITNIRISINIDGLPLAKSSQRQFWPILGSISDFKKVFVIGIYYGTQKPSNSNEFLRKFVDDTKILCEEGIIINDKSIPCRIDLIICDAPAKSFILGIKGHNGYSSCTKCITEGSYINGKMCFPEMNAQLRTDADFRSRKDENYHIGHSALLEIPNFDLVHGVPLDYMHLVCLGVTRKLLYMWLFGELKVRLRHRKVESISWQLENVLTLYMPSEFARKPRSLAFVKLWKATEFRNLLLYTGPIAFKSFLQKDLYDHFIVLHVAIRILCSSSLRNFIDYAHDLLQHFVSSFKLLYGTHNVSHNVHGLNHIVQDVRKLGTLDCFSAFKFENYLQTFKKLLKKHDKPLEQIVRRYMEYEQNKINKVQECEITCSHFVVDLKSVHIKGPLIEGCYNPQYRIMRRLTTTIRIDTLADNCCSLTDGKIIEVKNIAYCEELNTNVIIGHEFCNRKDLYDIPCPSSLIGIFIVENLFELKRWPVENVETKYVKLPLIKDNEFAVFPLLHQ